MHSRQDVPNASRVCGERIQTQSKRIDVDKDLSRKSDHLGTRVLKRSEPERRGHLAKSKSVSMARTNNSFFTQSCNIKNGSSHEEDRSTKSAALDGTNGGSFHGGKSCGGIPRGSGSFRLSIPKSVRSLNQSMGGGSGHDALEEKSKNSNTKNYGSSHEDGRSTKSTTSDCITGSSFHGEDCKRKSFGGTRGSGSFRLSFSKSVRSLSQSMGVGSGHDALEDSSFQSFLDDNDDDIDSESFCQSPKEVPATKDSFFLETSEEDCKQESLKGANHDHGVEEDRYVSFICGGSHQPPIAQFSCRELDFVLCALPGLNN